MPTGYTYPVAEGKITEFPAFALQCARAFGALIMMRDDDMNAAIPEEFRPNTKYYDDRIAADMKRMSEIQAMTNAEADEAAEAAYGKALQERGSYLADREQEGVRLNAMLAKVRAWKPPTPEHVEMKSFMIDQLTMSMPGNYSPSMPVLLDGATWRHEQIDELSKAIVRNREEVRKEIERTAKRNEWLKNLRASLAA